MVLAVPLLPRPAAADHSEYGVLASVRATNRDHSFEQRELFARFPGAPGDPEGAIATHWVVTLGMISGAGGEGLIASVGGDVRLQSPGRAGFVEVGFRPSLITRDRYGTTDLGYHLEFISHIGLGVRVGPRATVSFRGQHMSNGGLSENNPGINTTAISIGYGF